MTKFAGDGRKVRVVGQSLVDLMEREKCVTFNDKLRCEGINNRDYLPVFDGMRLRIDTSRTLGKRRSSLAEAHADVKTADGNLVRVFCVAMTSRKNCQIKKTSNTTAAEARNVMIETTMAGVVSKGLNGLVEYLMVATLSRHIVSRRSRVFPLENVSVRKVKVMKADKNRLVPATRRQRGTPVLWRSLSAAWRVNGLRRVPGVRAFSFCVVGSIGARDVLLWCPSSVRRQQNSYEEGALNDIVFQRCPESEEFAAAVDRLEKEKTAKTNDLLSVLGCESSAHRSTTKKTTRSS